MDSSYAGHSSARHECTWVAKVQSADIHGLIIYKSQICEKVLRRMLVPVVEAEE
jgi:hypothetical protein